MSLADLGTGVSKRELESAFMGHVLATATLIGTYRKRE
ncbi:MAG TPA: YbhB/YbcL family Raf kinase inhibitor-like protein [Labilithrix sp.]|nr:YbhB/YbcL family Raf kinase inhibitor-like protein [Labilithrix sp.]